MTRSVELLGGNDIRELAGRLGVMPTKKLGQNFVTDPNTIRRIVAAAGLKGNETVVEIGPGLGSLTLGLLEQAGRVVAVEIDQKLADEPSNFSTSTSKPSRSTSTTSIRRLTSPGSTKPKISASHQK